MKKVIVLDSIEQVIHVIQLPQIYENDIEEFLADGNKNEVESFSTGNINYMVVEQVEIKMY